MSRFTAIGLAVLATVMVLAPCIADDSDASENTTLLEYLVDGDVFATRTPGYFDDVPVAPEKEGYYFQGWTFRGELVNPATYDFPDGPCTLVAKYVSTTPEPEPEPEPEPMDTQLIIAYVFLAVVVVAIVFIAYRMYRNE